LTREATPLGFGSSLLVVWRTTIDSEKKVERMYELVEQEETKKVVGEDAASTDDLAVSEDVESPPLLHAVNLEEDGGLKLTLETISTTIRKQKGQLIGVCWCHKVHHRRIGLRCSDDGVYVANILERTPASQTLLRRGMRLVSINGVDFSESNVDEVTSFLNELDEGDLAIVANVDRRHHFARKVARNQAPSSKHRQDSRSMPGPPPGVDEPGVWGTNTYFGDQTCIDGALCCFFGGLVAGVICCCIEHDKRQVYKTQDFLYDRDGNLIGRVGKCNFVEEHDPSTINREEQTRACNIASFVSVTSVVIYFIMRLYQQGLV